MTSLRLDPRVTVLLQEEFIKKASVLELSQLGLPSVTRPVLVSDLELQPVEQRLQSVQAGLLCQLCSDLNSFL